MARENEANADAKDATTSTRGATQQEQRANAPGNLPIKASRPANPFEALEASKDEAEAAVGNAGSMILAAQEKGFHGFTPDPTPNENYTVGGVIQDAPTPETNKRMKVEARSRVELPADIPFIPKNQEQFEQAIEYRKGTETAE